MNLESIAWGALAFGIVGMAAVCWGVGLIADAVNAIHERFPRHPVNAGELPPAASDDPQPERCRVCGVILPSRHVQHYCARRRRAIERNGYRQNTTGAKKTTAPVAAGGLTPCARYAILVSFSGETPPRVARRPCQQPSDGDTDMDTIVIIRAGQVVMRIPHADTRSDGTLWYKGNPILNKSAPGALTPADAAQMMRAGKFDDIPVSMYVRMGPNAGGLDVLAAAEWDRLCADAAAAKRARYEADHPGAAERRAIEDAFAAANKLEHSPSEDNVWRPIQMRAEARQRLAAWRSQYPAEAAEEDAAELRTRADHEDSLASGALTYDADGSLSAEDQERRAAEHTAKAADYRRQANALTAPTHSSR